MIPTAELVTLHRSAAMAPPGSSISLKREEALAVLDELLQLRALVERVGGDLRDWRPVPGVRGPEARRARR